MAGILSRHQCVTGHIEFTWIASINLFYLGAAYSKYNPLDCLKLPPVIQFSPTFQPPNDRNRHKCASALRLVWFSLNVLRCTDFWTGPSLSWFMLTEIMIQQSSIIQHGVSYNKLFQKVTLMTHIFKASSKNDDIGCVTMMRRRTYFYSVVQRYQRLLFDLIWSITK